MAKTFNTKFRNTQGGIKETSSSYVVKYEDYLILVDATNKPLTITLPKGAGWGGKKFAIKKIDSSSNIVTIATSSGETIDSQSTITLTQQDQSSEVISDNENFLTLGISDGPTVSVVPKSFLLANSNATLAAANNKVIRIDTLGKQRGTNITLNLSTWQFTLKKDKLYKLMGNAMIQDGGGAMEFQFYNVTAGEILGPTQSHFNVGASNDGGGIVFAYLEPSVDTVIEFRFGIAGAGTLGFISGSRKVLPQVMIEEI